MYTSIYIHISLYTHMYTHTHKTCVCVCVCEWGRMETHVVPSAPPPPNRCRAVTPRLFLSRGSPRSISSNSTMPVRHISRPFSAVCEDCLLTTRIRQTGSSQLNHTTMWILDVSQQGKAAKVQAGETQYSFRG